MAGPRVVPVELGRKYTDDEWSQRLMPMSSFIDDYIVRAWLYSEGVVIL